MFVSWGLPPVFFWKNEEDNIENYAIFGFHLPELYILDASKLGSSLPLSSHLAHDRESL